MFFGHPVLNAISPQGKISSTHETPPEVIEICTGRGLTEASYWLCTFIFIAACHWEFMDWLQAIHISTERECLSRSLTANTVDATAAAVKNYQLEGVEQPLRSLKSSYFQAVGRAVQRVHQLRAEKRRCGQ
jgi:hypothetical protein